MAISSCGISTGKKQKHLINLATLFYAGDIYSELENSRTGSHYYAFAAGYDDNKIPALTFSPLTALIRFGLKNTSDRELRFAILRWRVMMMYFPQS